MKTRSFEQEWMDKVSRVRDSSFWRQVSNPPSGRIEPAREKPGRHEVAVDAQWTLVQEGDFESEGSARTGIEDLRHFMNTRFGIELRAHTDSSTSPRILFQLRPDAEGGTTRWNTAFDLHVAPDRITVRAATETALLRAGLYLSNYWGLRRNLYLPRGRRRVRPAVSLHIGADLWGGFSTTQAWVHGRENDTNFLELARMGINAVPIMTLLEDYLDPPSGPFQSLRNARAGENRRRLAQLARQAARYGVYIFLMGYNPKLDPEHPVFAAHPEARGAIQGDGDFRTLCTSDPTTRRFLVDAWASLFTEIPDLGGILAITGGEGFYHCFMRSRNTASDCPGCGHRQGAEVVSELVNEVARGIRVCNPEARLLTWPYSAGHWSHDRDQTEFINRLDPEHVIFQTEVDKDSVDWRFAGYAKNIWDYSMSTVSISDRCRRQRRFCRDRRLPFSVKLEVNNSIECLSVPYLPALENQRQIWDNARRLRTQAIHSRWLFDGSCKSPSEELGFWAIWGRNTEFDDFDQALTAIAYRDFGVRAAAYVRRAWRFFSEAMRHHPQLDYYVGSYFVGVGQPLVLRPEQAVAGGSLDPSFFGRFYWHWERTTTGDDASFSQNKALFYARPGFRAIARRGSRRGQDVALDELQALARLWERGVREMDKAAGHVPSSCRSRFEQEWILARHLAFTWRSAAHVEEFLRLRDTIREFSGQLWVRSGHRRENMRDLTRMQAIAVAELDLARQDLELVGGVDFLDLSLRLDMGTASTETILEAKIRQVEHLLSEDLPAWREELLRW